MPHPCGDLVGTPLSLLTRVSPALAVLLFPAMSMLSVGGMLLILTNTQVGFLHPDPPVAGAPCPLLGVPESIGGSLHAR